MTVVLRTRRLIECALFYQHLLVVSASMVSVFFFFQAEDGIRDLIVTGVQTCALPIFSGDSHGSQFARTSNYAGFFFLVSSIQNFMWYVFQSGAQPLGFLNAHRPNQNWLTGQMHAADFLNDGPLLLLLCSKQNVRMVHADHLPVGRNDFDI